MDAPRVWCFSVWSVDAPRVLCFSVWSEEFCVLVAMAPRFSFSRGVGWSLGDGSTSFRMSHTHTHTRMSFSYTKMALNLPEVYATNKILI